MSAKWRPDLDALESAIWAVPDLEEMSRSIENQISLVEAAHTVKYDRIPKMSGNPQNVFAYGEWMTMGEFLDRFNTGERF